MEVGGVGGTDQDYDTIEDNRLEFDGTYHYSYDNEGNRTRRFIDNDDSNSYTAGDTVVTAYYWDHRNRLIQLANHPILGGTYNFQAQNRRGLSRFCESARKMGLSHSLNTVGDCPPL